MSVQILLNYYRWNPSDLSALNITIHSSYFQLIRKQVMLYSFYDRYVVFLVTFHVRREIALYV